METSAVRQAVRTLLHQVKRPAADRREDRRAQTDQATREYAVFLERIAVPLFKQVANVLRTENYPFDVFTPGGSVRLTSERGSDNYIEVVLDTNGVAPKLLGRVSCSRGGDVTQTELVLNATTDISALTEEDLLGFVLAELEPFVEAGSAK
jgi:hypothetical protein